MKHYEFIRQLDEARIVAAIAQAERRSSGEIRVYVSHKERRDVLAWARRRFAKLGMTRTRHRNGVLIYFAPLSRQFAVVGDTGIHAKVGGAFWSEVVTGMEPLLKSGQFTEAVIEAVRKVGDVLATHFPREGGDRNELSDAILRD